MIAEVTLAVGFGLGVLGPLVGALERRRGRALNGERPEPEPRRLPAVAAAARADSRSGGHAVEPLSRAGWLEWIVWLPVLGICALVPYGGVYSWGGESVSLVAIDPRLSLLVVLAFAGLVASLRAVVLAGRAAPSDGVSEALVESLTAPLVFGFALIGLVMTCGTWRLVELVAAQDASASLVAGLEALGARPPDWLRSVSPAIPYWGGFRQPGGFLISLGCVLVLRARRLERVPPYRRDIVPRKLGGRILRSLPRAELCLSSSLLVTLFVGGWAVPWWSTTAIVGALAPWFGSGAATLLCIAIHLTTFGGKVLAMVWLQLWLESRLPPIATAQSLGLQWSVLLPLALANVLVTAVVMIAMGDVAR